MSEKENMKIEALERKADKLDQKVEQIYTAISGDEKMGLKGIVEVLNDHVAQSKKNNEILISEVKDFKRNVVYDYANNFNRVEANIASINEGLFAYRKEIDAKVEKIDNRTKNYGYYIGVALGVGAVGYFILDYLI